jgi:hypothetical protein
MKAFTFIVRWLLILISTFFLISCALLPAIKPAERTAETVLKCRRPFLDTPHRFVHAIEVSLPGGGVGTVLGITVFDPASRSIRSAVVTIEGFVLFDAGFDKDLHVYRALPPFNAERFAEHMMEDIRLIFLPPEERLSDAGTLEDGSTICRYGGNQDKTVDVIVHRDDTWEIMIYRNRFERLRKISAYSLQDGIPGMLELTAFESGYYSLSLKLISAETVSAEEIRSSQEKKPDDE